MSPPSSPSKRIRTDVESPEATPRPPRRHEQQQQQQPPAVSWGAPAVSWGAPAPPSPPSTMTTIISVGDIFCNAPHLPPSNDGSETASSKSPPSPASYSYNSRSDAGSSGVASSASRKRKYHAREKSPVRNVAALRVSNIETHFELLFRNTDLSAEVGIRALAQRITWLGSGRGVISPRDKEAMDHIMQDMNADLPDSLQRQEESTRLTCSTRSHLGRPPSPRQIDKLLNKQYDAMKLNKSEASWNENIHGPLFEQVQELSAYGDQVCYENITTAHISPEHLPLFSDDAVLPSKKVDYGWCIQLSAEQLSRLKSKGITDLNHAAPAFEALRLTPLAVSVETKTSNSSLEEAKLQLTIWALAHRAKLRQLLVKAGRLASTPLPSLPLLVSQACEWNMYFLEAAPSPAAALNGAQSLVLRGPVRLGNSNTRLGLYSVFASLQCVVEWMHGPFREWWEREILN